MSKKIKLREMLKKLPVFSIIILITFVLIGVFGGFIAPHDPNTANFADALTPPSWMDGGNVKYLLGTDQLGRDLLSRLICGASISLQVGFVVVVVAGLIGTVIAVVAGYMGGWIDSLLMRLTDTVMSIPYLTIAIVLVAILGPNKNNIIVIFALVGWTSYARILRSEVLSLKEKEFVSLAVVGGCSKISIMINHIFPNLVNTLVIISTLQLGSVIIAEAALSYLGVGVPPPDPAWGLMISEGRSYMATAWWLSAWPGILILLVVLSCNLLGDWLRLRLDPNFKQLN